MYTSVFVCVCVCVCDYALKRYVRVRDGDDIILYYIRGHVLAATAELVMDREVGLGAVLYRCLLPHTGAPIYIYMYVYTAPGL